MLLRTLHQGMCERPRTATNLTFLIKTGQMHESEACRRHILMTNSAAHRHHCHPPKTTTGSSGSTHPCLLTFKDGLVVIPLPPAV